MSELSEKSEISKHGVQYPVVFVRGTPFPTKFIAPGVLEKVLDMKAKDDDVFIVTYPKCGTTWTEFIVWEIMHKGAVPPSPNQMEYEHVYFLDIMDLEFLDSLNSPRVLKSHLPANLMPYNPSAKYISVLRNPWDCCVSFYHHRKMFEENAELSFDEHFEQFLKGDVGWGDFFDHTLSWFKRRNDHNVLFLTYEDMKKDAKHTMLKIAKFLGDSYYKDLQNEEVLQQCLKHSSFEYMKGLGFFLPKDFKGKEKVEVRQVLKALDKSTADPGEYRETNFFRKGKTGDWKNYFTQSQIKKLNEHMIKKLKDTEMANFWKPIQEETSL